MITVRKYESDDREIWNHFVENAKTHCILFSRNFMEYHKDRFEDHSLMVFDDQQLVAVMPANIRGKELVSHAGLTFGGIVVGKNTYTKDTLQYIGSVCKYCQEQGIELITIKQSPSFYSCISQDEVDYAMFVSQAELYRVDIAYAIDLQAPHKIPYQERRKRAVKKALKANIEIRESEDFSAFWNIILTPNLLERFGVKPVHSLEEIISLQANNPGRIRQFEAWRGEELLAGSTVFESNDVAHAQYISANDEGRRSGAIDLLFDKLIHEYFAHKRFFDFGIVNEEEGRKLNLGLLDWKEGFGARAYAHRFYRLRPSAHTIIEQLLTPAH